MRLYQECNDARRKAAIQKTAPAIAVYRGTLHARACWRSRNAQPHGKSNEHEGATCRGFASLLTTFSFIVM